ncbi:MAG: PQQ-binding-like beta-propeller repeat protein [Marinilabiliaceae bacterium]|nr:PQQ-binding-like beta-propeller repeat protein [Marinilabiliaceae bacterium]
MKQIITRNIAAVSVIFIITFSIMLITNYFQVSSSETIQSEIIEKLKQANEELGDNPQLLEQIRELDLLARKAYFINQSRMKLGIAILLFMVIVFVISIRIFYAKSKNIPDKEIDPIDFWLIKSKARKHIVWIVATISIGGIIFAILTSPYLTNNNNKTIPEIEIEMSENETNSIENDLYLLSDSIDILTEIETDSISSDLLEVVEISKVTHNGFRGNNSLGINGSSKVPTTWDLTSGKNILWKAEVPRKGFNSPVINGNKLFFTGADDAVRELFCYELSSGKELWRLAAKNIPGSPSKMPDTTDDTGLAAPSAVTNGKYVCAIFGMGDVICADIDGKLIWSKNIGIPDNHYGYASSPIIFGNLLIIQYDNHNSPRVIALDLATGNQRWMTERPDKIAWSSPIIAYVNNTPQLLLIGNPSITSYNPNNGEQNWRVVCMSGEVGASLAYANGIVVGASEYATMIAIDATDGTVLWEDDEFLPEVASPVATKDFFFIATDYGVVASFDIKTGSLIKSMELNTGFYSSPIIVEGKIYLAATDGKIFIFSAKGDFNLINSFQTGDKIYATPAFTDQKIVIKGNKWIYCVASE